MRNIELMRCCGISSSLIIRYVFNFPRFYLHKTESFLPVFKRAEDMGLNRKSNMFLAANWMLSSMSEENWELKLKHFKRLGFFFFEENTMSTFRRTSQVFVVSERKIKEVTEFLIRRKKNRYFFYKKPPGGAHLL